jgi:hypothetical protein
MLQRKTDRGSTAPGCPKVLGNAAGEHSGPTGIVNSKARLLIPPRRTPVISPPNQWIRSPNEATRAFGCVVCRSLGGHPGVEDLRAYCEP